MRGLHHRTMAITIASIFAIVGVLLPSLSVGQTARPGPRALAFDVAEDGTRFVFDETPAHEDGSPDYGGEFTTQGYIYPAGTLTNRDGVTNGVNPDGSPEFPDKVIGTWTCYGTHLGQGAKTRTGPWVATTQIFDIGDEPGDLTIVSSGVEVVDIDTPVRRAVIGNTGLPEVAGSEQVQSMIGFNQSQGVTLQVRFAD